MRRKKIEELIKEKLCLITSTGSNITDYRLHFVTYEELFNIILNHLNVEIEVREVPSKREIVLKKRPTRPKRPSKSQTHT